MEGNRAFARTQMLLGRQAMERLARAHVAVFGVGGVGAAVVEALARCGIGELTLVDEDIVSETNLNRQLIATREWIGKPKVEAARARIESIHPDCRVHALKLFYTRDAPGAVQISGCDCVVDAIDTVSAKVTLIERATELGIPVISSMGTGNKLDPTRFEIADIYETSVCPLARVMRRELRARGVRALPVLYSKEEPLACVEDSGEALPVGKRSIPGSISFVPPAAGLMIAGWVIRRIVQV